MSALIERLKVLATGKVTWVDDDDGTEDEVLSWADRWTLFGVHAHNWAWVRRFGARDCGCTVNPLTGRRLLIRWGCPTHSVFGPVRERLSCPRCHDTDCDDNCQGDWCGAVEDVRY